MDFQLRYLAYLFAVVEEQSFSKAAEKLAISQSSLSQRVQTLEAQVGFPLLMRNSHGVTLTPEGQHLLNPFRELVSRGERIARVARDLLDSNERPLRVGATMHSASPERSSLMNAFLDAYPEKQIQVETIYTPDLYLGLLAARYDMGFVVGPVFDCNYENLVIRKYRTQIIFPADSPLARHSELPRRALKGLTIMCIRRQRFPELFDLAIQPLADSGAVLSYPADQTPTGLLAHCRWHRSVIATAFPLWGDDVMQSAGLVCRSVQGLNPPIALMLVRPRVATTPVGAAMWDFARNWISDAAKGGPLASVR